jgi:predicted RNA polymerase sigma factor
VLRALPTGAAGRAGLSIWTVAVPHAIRADLLRRLGHIPEAAQAYEKAIACTENALEREFLECRQRALSRVC